METWTGFGTSQALTVQNDHATEPLELFLTSEAATAGAGAGILLYPGMERDLAVELRTFWTLSTNASHFRALIIGR